MAGNVCNAYLWMMREQFHIDTAGIVPVISRYDKPSFKVEVYDLQHFRGDDGQSIVLYGTAGIKYYAFLIDPSEFDELTSSQALIWFASQSGHPAIDISTTRPGNARTLQIVK